MKIIPINLASEVLTVAYLWKLERRDGYVIGLTDHDQSIFFQWLHYHPGGFTPSAVRSTSDSSVDNLETEGILDPENNFISEADLRNGLWDYTRITLYRVDYTNPNDRFEIIRTGWTGEVTIKPGQYRAELRGLLQKLQQNVGIIVTKECRHNLGDEWCGVDLSDHTVTGVVEEGSDDRYRFIDPERTEADDLYSGGRLTFTKGKNAGASVAVRRCADGEVLLTEEMVYPIEEGDEYLITKGCNKEREGDCLKKFNNTINHGGFADLPGRDRLSTPTPTHKN